MRYIFMKHLFALVLVAAMPFAKAEIPPNDVKRLVEASRLDLRVLSFRLTVSETNNRIARGMPTQKLADIFRGFAGKIDVKTIYQKAVSELASELEPQQLKPLMQCFSSDFMHQYHVAQYQRLTREGAQAFRDQLVPLDLGITEPDPARMAQLDALQVEKRNPEIWKDVTRQMFWLINLDVSAKYPKLGRDKESMDAFFSNPDFEQMSDESHSYGKLVTYVMMKSLDDDQLEDLLSCFATPEMAAYDDITTVALRDYLVEAEASWVATKENAL
ncbi:hypothetical protein [Marinobacter sp. CHS3-4]|uniref:hypothetical protein n=1 Tax=Marinobacter sp. CHS3-4 TaxID=3045174 RepID=UPI0024B4A482|nr:hypothetical protein [Marinobacter sp. CHS3-4]MDI9243823.1 hypothetical protein [Marinobacter sp. CHS3-4]